jgi:hypothetical protein
LDFMGGRMGRKSGDDDTPIRIWICKYALQCTVHVALVWMEFRQRNTQRTARGRSQLMDEEAHISEDDDEDDKVSRSPGSCGRGFLCLILKFLGSI